MTILDWPSDLAPVQCSFDPIAQASVYTDPRSALSLRQTRSQPVWQAQLVFQELTPCLWPRLQSLLAKLRGPVNTVRFWDFSNPGERVSDLAGVTHSDGSPFSDGSLYAVHPLTINANAAIGARTLLAMSGYDFTFTEGMKIALPGDKLYIVTEDVEVSAGVEFTLSIEGGLRAAVVTGDDITTYRPSAVFYRVGNDPVQRDLARFGGITLTFSEDISAV